MRISRTCCAATVLAGTLWAGAALADFNDPRTTAPGFDIGDQLGPVEVHRIRCAAGAPQGDDDSLAGIWIQNDTGEALAPRTSILWQTNLGQNGQISTGNTGLAPDGVVYVADSPAPFSCVATIAG